VTKQGPHHDFKNGGAKKMRSHLSVNCRTFYRYYNIDLGSKVMEEIQKLTPFRTPA